MANTYSQIYIQIVFPVNRWENLVPQKHKEEIHKYVIGIITNRDQKLLANNCMPDHAHIFVGMRPTCYIPDFLKEFEVDYDERYLFDSIE